MQFLASCPGTTMPTSTFRNCASDPRPRSPGIPDRRDQLPAPAGEQLFPDRLRLSAEPGGTTGKQQQTGRQPA
jgi:hypothetical protein